MGSETIIDQEESRLSNNDLLGSLAWWEKRRPWYNLLLALLGIVPFVIKFNSFALAEFVGMIVYGALANVGYSFGFLLEALEKHYLNDRIGLYKQRELLFAIGTVLSGLATLNLSWMYNSVFSRV